VGPDPYQSALREPPQQFARRFRGYGEDTGVHFYPCGNTDHGAACTHDIANIARGAVTPGKYNDVHPRCIQLLGRYPRIQGGSQLSTRITEYLRIEIQLLQR